MSKSYRELLTLGCDLLAKSSATPNLDANVLLRFAASKSELSLIVDMKELASEQIVESYLAYLKRRKAFEPVAYIIGVKEFWGLDFKVNSNVLVPRPETELIIELVLKEALKIKQKINLIDLGTGSGCIAISLASELKKANKDFSFTAVDVSSEALNVAQENAMIHKVNDCIDFVEGSWFDSISEKQEKFDIIISNPPYVRVDADDLSLELEYEPDLALFSNNKGLKDIYHIIDCLSRFANSNALFLCEIGNEQGEVVLAYAVSSGYKKVSVHKDLSELDRVLEIRI